VEGGRGSAETRVCLRLFLKIAEKREYTCGRTLSSGPKYVTFTYIPWIIGFGYRLAEKIPVS